MSGREGGGCVILPNLGVKPPKRMIEQFNFAEYRPLEVALPTSWNELPLYFDTGTACRLLKISIPTLMMYIKSGELKASKIAGKYRIDKDEFREFVRSQHTHKGDYDE